jgi:alcohol dehydrogenase class IV
VIDLRAELDVPHTLPLLGVVDPDIARMAKMAPDDPTAGGNPVPLDEAASARLLTQAVSGNL